MGIFSWISNKKRSDETSSKKEGITVEKALAFSRTYQELKPFFGLFLHSFKYILDSEEEIRTKLKEIQIKTGQNLKEEELLKEFLILRYASLHTWFFDVKPPKNQEELDDELLVISSALKSVLTDRNKLDYIPWLKGGLVNFFSDTELNFTNLENFQEKFAENLANKITQITFDSTGGRLGGELHDYIIELIMTTFAEDKKTFYLEDDTALTKEETENIKASIDELKISRQKAGKEFFEDLIGESIEEEPKSAMSLEEAKIVVDDYASFLSNCIEDRLHWIFHPIPDCLRPYPLNYLKNAFDLVRKDYIEQGDEHKAKLCDEIEAGFWGFAESDDETIMKETVKRCEDIKWKDTIITIVSEFRTRPPHKNYLENYKKISVESIDFDKLDIPTAHKIIQIFSIFLKEHMLFHTLFSAKIPEGFLPFTKEQLFKAIDVYINVYKTIEHENADTYATMKNIINEDYVSDEVAINELMKNLSVDETRSNLITELKEYQIKTARKKRLDRLGLNKKI